MKILFYTDVHWSVTSSILKKRGLKYSRRLESCINSVNWAETLAESIHADLIVCGGDFFDANVLKSEEVTALQEVHFAESIPHIFLVGNHELYTGNKNLTTAHFFNSLNNFTVVDMPLYSKLSHEDDSIRMLCLPYLSDKERLPLSDYIADKTKKTIVFSHNDIAGIQMGNFISKTGFDLSDIENNCDLFINGHLHNGGYLNSKKTILNVGNLTGQNFSEDGFKYSHTVAVIDTDTMSVKQLENPFAIYFYKLDTTTEGYQNVYDKLSKLIHSACVTIKCSDSEASTLKTIVNNIDYIVDYRMITQAQHSNIDLEKDKPILKSIDYIEEFKKCVLDDQGTSDILLQELALLS